MTTEPGATDARGRRLPQTVMPGMERSAKQAAAARGKKITARAPQRSAGGMFETKEARAPVLFDMNPKRRTRKKKKITRVRRNPYSTHRGLESGRDLDFATRMRIARTPGGSEERYNRVTGTPKFEDEDPLDVAVTRYKHGSPRLHGYLDDKGEFHPIRNSPGYDPTRTTDDPHSRKQRKITVRVKRNPKKRSAAKRPARRRPQPRRAVRRRTVVQSNPRRRHRPTPDSAIAAINRAVENHRMAERSQEYLVKLHNRMMARRRKSFDDVAVMTAAKWMALAKGAKIKKL